jgi:hypothetical protein
VGRAITATVGGAAALSISSSTEESAPPGAHAGAGAFPGKVLIVNSAAEASDALEDTGANPDDYRFYAVAGTRHVPDPLVPLFSNETTPASWTPALRAHFLQAHRWVRQGDPPAPSSAIGDDGAELPIVELGEAVFSTGFLGTYDAVKTIAGLGFGNHAAYLRAFNGAVDRYATAGSLLRSDASEMKQRAALCPPLTYTETYRDHYDQFVSITAC